MIKEYYPWYSPRRILGLFALVGLVFTGLLYALTYLMTIPFFILDLIVGDKRRVFRKYMNLKVK